MNKKNRNSLVVGLLVMGVILILGFIAGSDDSSANTCIELGCSNSRASDSSYCYVHKSHTKSSTRSSINSYKSTGSGTSDTSSDTNKQYTSTYYGRSASGKSSGSTSTYNTLNNDPVDYDDPEEYADDAWDDDFDSWDEAYDYWEDY